MRFALDRCSDRTEPNHSRQCASKGNGGSNSIHNPSPRSIDVRSSGTTDVYESAMHENLWSTGRGKGMDALPIYHSKEIAGQDSINMIQASSVSSGMPMMLIELPLSLPKHSVHSRANAGNEVGYTLQH